MFEVTPRLGGYVIGDAEYAFSIEKRIGGHVFSVVFANASGSTYGQLARGGLRVPTESRRTRDNVRRRAT